MFIKSFHLIYNVNLLLLLIASSRLTIVQKVLRSKSAGILSCRSSSMLSSFTKLRVFLPSFCREIKGYWRIDQLEYLGVSVIIFVFLFLEKLDRIKWPLVFWFDGIIAIQLSSCQSLAHGRCSLVHDQENLYIYIVKFLEIFRSKLHWNSPLYRRNILFKARYFVYY